MGNSNYIKGRRKEYAICKRLKSLGFDIAQRSAGSHSPIDVFAIHKAKREVIWVQSKPDKFPKIQADRIHEQLDYLNTTLKSTFILE